MFPLVLDLAADRIPVAVTCRVLGFSKQAFYQWQADPVSHRDWDDAHLINAAIDIHHDDPEFGYRFITDELAGPRHHRRPRTGSTGCAASSGSGRCTPASAACSRKPGPPVHDDLVDGEFTADGAEPAVADRHHRTPAPARASSTCARSRTPAPTGSSATPWPSG